MSAAGVAGERNAVSSAASWSASRSSSAGSVGAAATKTVAWGAVCTTPVLAPVEAVVGDAAAGLAVVFVVAGGDVVVELSGGAEDEVVVDSSAVVVLDSTAAAAAGGSPLSPPPQAPVSVRATSTAASFLVPMGGRA